MSGMPNIDWAAVGTALGSIGLLAGGIWAAWKNKQTRDAQVRAIVAESDASKTVADSQQVVYKTLVERVTTLEGEMRILRAELADERKHSRRLVLHIWRLENLMRKAGIEPPPFEEGDPNTSGMTT